MPGTGRRWGLGSEGAPSPSPSPCSERPRLELRSFSRYSPRGFADVTLRILSGGDKLLIGPNDIVVELGRSVAQHDGE